MVQQTRLIGIARSTVYAAKATTSEEELTLLGLIDEEYTRHPFYGNRRLVLLACIGMIAALVQILEMILDKFFPADFGG